MTQQLAVQGGEGSEGARAAYGAPQPSPLSLGRRGAIPTRRPAWAAARSAAASSTPSGSPGRREESAGPGCPPPRRAVPQPRPRDRAVPVPGQRNADAHTNDAHPPLPVCARAAPPPAA